MIVRHQAVHTSQSSVDLAAGCDGRFSASFLCCVLRQITADWAVSGPHWPTVAQIASPPTLMIDLWPPTCCGDMCGMSVRRTVPRGTGEVVMNKKQCYGAPLWRNSDGAARNALRCTEPATQLAEVDGCNMAAPTIWSKRSRRYRRVVFGAAAKYQQRHLRVRRKKRSSAQKSVKVQPQQLDTTAPESAKGSQTQLGRHGMEDLLGEKTIFLFS